MTGAQRAVRPHAEAETSSREAALLTGVLLAFVLLIFALTLRLGPSSRFIPLTVAVPLTPLLLYQLLRDLRGRDHRAREQATRQQPHGRAAADATGGTSVADAERQPSHGRELSTMLWLLLLPLLSTLLGFLAGPGLFVFTWMRFHARERTIVAAAGAALAAVVLYGLFTGLLETAIPEGMLIERLVRRGAVGP